MTRSHRRQDGFECPHCGADVAVGARVCRECGCDASTGWQSADEIDFQSLELPDGHAQDPAHPGGPVVARVPAWVVVTALVLVAVLAALWSGLLG